ncbi:MAG: hypothetical protein ACRDIA_08575, partial [Actinomycetota bacterium]
MPQPMVEVLPSSSGPPGTKVKLSGVNFNPGQVEIRWNAIDGPVIGTGNGPNFSEATAAVPKVAQGLYVIFLISREEGGAVGNTARTAFEVTGDPARSGDSVAAPSRFQGHGKNGATREKTSYMLPS